MNFELSLSFGGIFCYILILAITVPLRLSMYSLFFLFSCLHPASPQSSCIPRHSQAPGSQPGYSFTWGLSRSPATERPGSELGTVS